MKKKLFTSILASVGLIVAGGCSGESDADGGSSDGGSVVIEFGHGAAESNLRHDAALEFERLVEENSDGEITVDIYPNEQIGSEAEMIENVSLGDLDMALAGAGIYTQYDELIGSTELPYLFEDYEQAWEVLDGPIGDRVSEPLLEDGIRILSFFENGMRHLTNSSRAIETPEDLNGLTIRTPEQNISIDTLNALGANATPMAFGELYLGLQQGAVDGQENPLPNIYASSFYEVQDYLSLTGHQYSPLPLAVNDSFWNSLSSEQQEVIQQAADEAAQFHRDSVRDDDERLVEELEAEGMEVNSPDKAPFQEAVQSVHEEYAEVYGQDFMDDLKAAAEEAAQ